MGIRIRTLKIGLLVLFFGVIASHMAMAQQDANSQAQPPMSLLPASNVVPVKKSSDPRKYLIGLLHLNMYEAAAGKLSLCAGDGVCLKHAKMIRSWRCAAASCGGTDSSKKPLDCFEGSGVKIPKDAQDQINALACSLIRSPGAQTRQAVMSQFSESGTTEDELVENGAYLMALKGSAVSCEKYIKDYVGPYGPKWNYKWYRAMSGCRILGHKSTRKVEEKNYFTWFGVVQGLGSCSEIHITPMHNACRAPKAASPVPVHAQ